MCAQNCIKLALNFKLHAIVHLQFVQSFLKTSAPRLNIYPIASITVRALNLVL